MAKKNYKKTRYEGTTTSHDDNKAKSTNFDKRGFTKENFKHVPFNFVPLNHEVFIPKWGDKISQDVPFEDGEDGIIKVTVSNVTPMLIGDSIVEANAEEILSANINGRYYIPGSSLKGMLRSVLEILSFSKMKESLYNDDSMGYRDFNDDDYTDKLSEVYCGWLHIYEGHSYISNPLKVDVSYYNRSRFRFPKDDTSIKIEVKDDVVKAFVTSHKPSKYYKEAPSPFNRSNRVTIIEAQRTGKGLAVFFSMSNEGVILSIGMARYYRLPYLYKISDGIKKQKKVAGRDLTECIFGYIDDDKSPLRGRVQIGNAFMPEDEEEVFNPQTDIVNDIKTSLWSPHASYYPYYIKQTNRPYKDYKSADMEISGRKRYRIRNGNNYDTAHDEDGKAIHLIKDGHMFVFEIRVHNLRPIEIGALLSALTFHGNNNVCFHNIGMGKPFGWGKLKVNGLSMDFFAHDETYYMNVFESCMDEFEKGMAGIPWQSSEQFQYLLAIAKEHGYSMAYMGTTAYRQGKLNKNFTVLEESGLKIEPRIEKTATERDEEKRQKKEAKQQWKAEKDVDLGMAQSTSIEEDLMAWLEKKDKSGNSVKRLRAIVENFIEWKKSKGLTCVSQQVIEELETSMRHIYSMKMKDEYRKEWQAFTSDPWRKLVRILGEDNARRIFNKIINNE